MEGAELRLSYDKDVLTYMSGSGGNNFSGSGGNGSGSSGRSDAGLKYHTAGRLRSSSTTKRHRTLRVHGTKSKKSSTAGKGAGASSNTSARFDDSLTFKLAEPADTEFDTDHCRSDGNDCRNHNREY